MNTSSIKNFDELPLFLNAQLVSRTLGISPSSAYELLHEDGFPSLRIEGALRKLVAAGELKKEGKGKNTCYFRLN